MNELLTVWLLPCLYAFLACFGFCLIFNIHGPGILICGSGGMLGWLVYLLAGFVTERTILRYLIAAIVITLYSEVMARIRKCPVTSYLLVALLPFVPGSGIYAAMRYCVQGDVGAFLSALLHTLEPLFSVHLLDAGVGTVSEIFDGSTPHTPNGCISQAWSVAECVRVLRLTQMAAPEVYGQWEERLLRAMKNGLGTGMGIMRPSAVVQATGGRG